MFLFVESAFDGVDNVFQFIATSEVSLFFLYCLIVVWCPMDVARVNFFDVVICFTSNSWTIKIGA